MTPSSARREKYISVGQGAVTQRSWLVRSRRATPTGARETGRAAVCEHTVYVVLLLSVEIRIQS